MVMRAVIAVVCLAAMAGVVCAQERIAPDEATKIAKLFVEQAAKLEKLQLKLDADADKPFGLKKDDVGAMVLPDKKLSVDALQKLDKEVLPVAHLWFRKLTPLDNGQAVANER